MKTRLFLTFPKTSLERPILSSLTSRFGVVFNIFGATMNEDTQFFAIEIEGDEAQIGSVMAFLEEEGVGVEEKDADGSPS